MVDITNQLFNDIEPAVLAAYPKAVVAKTYQSDQTTFPYVTLIDLDNMEIDRNLSNTGLQSKVSWQIDIYTDGGNREITAKKIRDLIAQVLEGKYHMTRVTSRPVTNAADTTIYRWMMRYSCKIDEDRNLIY